MIRQINCWLLAGAGGLSLIVAGAALAGSVTGFTTDTIGFRDDNTGNFKLKNENSGGGADENYGFGSVGLGDLPVTGTFEAGAGCRCDRAPCTTGGAWARRRSRCVASACRT